MEDAMKSESKFRDIRSNGPILSAGIMAMAASLADEIAEKWPFMAAHLRLDVFGAVGHSYLHEAIGKAATLGLSGIVDGAADARKIAGIFALQHRMMAVRLAGRKQGRRWVLGRCSALIRRTGPKLPCIVFLAGSTAARPRRA